MNTKTCKYCGSEYIVSEREWYSEHNGKSGVDIIGSCNCDLGKLLNSIKRDCKSCYSYKSGMCYNKDHITEFKNTNKLFYDIPYINATSVCKEFVANVNVIPKEYLSKVKCCYSCKYKYKNKCSNKQNVNDVMDKIREYKLPISSLMYIDKPESNICDNYELSSNYIENLFK